MRIIPEPGWEGVAEDLIRHKGTTLVMGATDSGKSTVAKYLIRELISRDIRVSLVDSDIGQSSLGLPGTISMKIFHGPEDLEEFRPDKVFFVGDVNPAKKIPILLEGTKRMVDAAKAEGVRCILVDTTGLISGGLGERLKIGKIRAIKPRHVIALQRSEELEHILSLIKFTRIHRLNVSGHLRKRSREKRAKYRSRRYAEYFSGSRTVLRPFKGLEFLHNGKKIEVEGIKPGRLMGINRGEETFAFGIFKGIRMGKIAIRTPLKSFHGVDRILIGDVSL